MGDSAEKEELKGLTRAAFERRAALRDLARLTPEQIQQQLSGCELAVYEVGNRALSREEYKQWKKNKQRIDQLNRTLQVAQELGLPVDSTSAGASI